MTQDLHQKELPQKDLPLEYRQIFSKLKGQVDQASRGGLKSTSIQSIEDFAHTYLVALSMLSRIRANPNWYHYLPPCQKLLVDANVLLYPEEDVSLKRIWAFLWDDLPAQFWASRYFHLASFAIVLLSGLLGFIIVRQNFEMAPLFIPTGLRSSHDLEAYLFSQGAQEAMLTQGRDMSTGIKALFATELMIHNIQVALTCFVSGFLFGLPTLLILLQTGLMLGAFPALFYNGDLTGLGAWLLPHGVPEVSAIIFAGGAGLQLGYVMLRQSPIPLGVQLKNTLRKLSGTVALFMVLLVWAGIVESFVRQSELDYAARYLIAAVSLIPIYLFFLRAWLADRKLKGGVPDTN